MTFLDELAKADEEERAELARLGVHLPHAETDGMYYLATEGAAAMSDAALQAQTDAVVSQLQRRMIALSADIQRYIDAARAETELIRERYRNAAEPVIRQYDRTEAIILDIANRADFGKKKSRETPHGSYGIRSVPASVEIVDEKALLAWAQSSQPQLVERVEIVVERVTHNRLTTYVSAAIGLIPIDIPGVVERPAEQRPFVKLAEGA